MTRVYKSKLGIKKRKQHPHEAIQKALDAIKTGKTYRDAQKNLTFLRVFWQGI